MRRSNRSSTPPCRPLKAPVKPSEKGAGIGSSTVMNQEPNLLSELNAALAGFEQI